MDSRRDLLYSTFAKKIIEPFHYRLKLSGGDQATFVGTEMRKLKKGGRELIPIYLRHQFIIFVRKVLPISVPLRLNIQGTISPSISWLNLMRYQIDLEKW